MTEVDFNNGMDVMGFEGLTPARALIADLVRRYWILGMECSLLEIQNLAWFLQRVIQFKQLQNNLKLNFIANNYGPYANNLDHLLNALDGSYLKSDKRIPDCNPMDVIAFNDEKKQQIELYLKSECKEYLDALIAYTNFFRKGKKKLKYFFTLIWSKKNTAWSDLKI